MTVFEALIPIIPIVIMIILIIITRRILECCIFALFLAYFLYSPANLLTNLSDGMFSTVQGPTFSFLIIAIGAMGIFIRLLIESGGTTGFAKYISKYVNNQKKSLIATYIMGLIVFIDEYLNALVVTSSMRKLTDKYKTPRVMLACAVNAVGVPACIFVPISIWAIYYIGLITDSGILEGTGLTGFGMYVRTIPFMVYPWVFVILILMLFMGLFPKIGPMKTAYKRASELGDVFPESGCVGDLDEEIKEGHLAFFVIPMLSIIGITIFTEDICIAAIISSILLGAMLVFSKKMKIKEVTDAAINGVKDMAYTLVLLFVVFTFAEISKDIGFVDFTVTATATFMTAWLLPPFMFILSALLSQVIGSFWATSALLMPIVIELAVQLDVSMPLMMGVLISGAVFPATSSFTCESIVMSSQAAQVQPAEVGLANIVYGLIAAGISTVLFLIIGIII